MIPARTPTRRLFGAALLMGALFAPAALAGQEAGDDQVQAWIAEMREVQAQLEPLQAQALQEPELQQKQAQVVEAVVEQMVAADPENAARIERMEQIMEEAGPAQEAGDAETIAALTEEVAELQPQIQAAQAAALSHPDVQPVVAEFQQVLQKRMIEIDPKAREHIARLELLQTRVAAMTGGA